MYIKRDTEEIRNFVNVSTPVPNSNECNFSRVFIGTHHGSGTKFGYALRDEIISFRPNFTLDITWHFRASLTNSLKGKLIHLVRDPLRLIQSKYNYHLKGNENNDYNPAFVKGFNPIECGWCFRKKSEALAKLQNVTNEILLKVNMTRHGDILQALDEDEGLVYEACWEFCNIHFMMEAGGLKGKNILRLDIDHLEGRQEDLQKFICMEIGDITTIKRTENKQHINDMSPEQKEKQLNKIKSMNVIAQVYEKLMKYHSQA